MKTIALLLFGGFIIHPVSAQTLKGKVMENRTDIMLSGIKVENQTRHSVTVTDPFGNFSINAQKGDLLFFSGLNYGADTVYLVSLKNLVVYLELRQNQLKEVKVNTTEIKGSFKSKGETGLFGSHTILYKEGGGLKIKLFDSHKAENKREAERVREINDQKQADIDGVFNAAILKNYLPITGQELANFVIKYKPDFKTFYTSSFNLADYVNNCYKDFLKVPAEKRRSPTYMSLDKSGN